MKCQCYLSGELAKSDGLEKDKGGHKLSDDCVHLVEGFSMSWPAQSVLLISADITVGVVGTERLAVSRDIGPTVLAGPSTAAVSDMAACWQTTRSVLSVLPFFSFPFFAGWPFVFDL